MIFCCSISICYWQQTEWNCWVFEWWFIEKMRCSKWFGHLCTEKYKRFHFPSWICCLEHTEINGFWQKSTIDSYVRSQVDWYSSGKPETKILSKSCQKLQLKILMFDPRKYWLAWVNYKINLCVILTTITRFASRGWRYHVLKMEIAAVTASMTMSMKMSNKLCLSKIICVLLRIRYYNYFGYFLKWPH